jgi:hypothetical protein
MSTEIATRMEDHLFTRFWGGDTRGGCVQITAQNTTHGEGFIQLTMEEAAALCHELSVFLKDEALRRQKLLREQIQGLQVLEKTIFQEIANLSPDLLEVPLFVVNTISQTCPKTNKGAPHA